MRKLAVLFCLITGYYCSLSAQDNPQSKIFSRKAPKGTYQLIVSGPRVQAAFPESILYEIEKNRAEKKVNYLQLTPQAKVKILPYSEINSSTFVPVKDEIIFED